MEIRYKILTNRKIIKPHVDYLSRLEKKKKTRQEQNKETSQTSTQIDEKKNISQIIIP